jgi:hypothetical protein
MLEAHRVASEVWKVHASPFSRLDGFTLPQLFACLVLREMLRLSYRKAEQLLRDATQWLAAIGLPRAPDHNTLWRASGQLLKTHKVNRVLDLQVQLFDQKRLLKLSVKPLTIDSTCYEERHHSHHYDRVCTKMGLKRGLKYAAKTAAKADPAQVNRSRSAKVRAMPKLALAAATSCQLILAARVHTGNGSDSPDFVPLLWRAWKRVRRLNVAVADAGFDSENNHRFARLDLGVRSIIPPRIGRPTTKPPRARFRRLMHHRFKRKADRRWYGQRAQSETVNSMMKRNLGDALRAVRTKRREQEMLLRVLTHNLMLIAAEGGG